MIKKIWKMVGPPTKQEKYFYRIALFTALLIVLVLWLVIKLQVI